MISPSSDGIVDARMNPDQVSRGKEHVLLQVPPAAQTFPRQLHLHQNLACDFLPNRYILYEYIYL